MRLRRIATVIHIAMIVCMFHASASAAVRIAVLLSMDGEQHRETAEGFQRELERRGLQPAYEVVNLDGNADGIGHAVQKIRQGGFDLALVLGGLAAEAAVREIRDIPIVAGLTLRPETLKNGAQNATGVVLEFPIETQLQLMRRILPRAHAIGILFNAKENRVRVDAATSAAQKMGLKIVGQEVASPRDIPAALDRLSQTADVILGIPDSVVLAPQLAKPILLYSFRNSIPFAAPSATWVKAGAFYSFDYDYREIGAQCAAIAFRILKEGIAPPPPEYPRSIHFSINLNTARMMRIPVSEDLRREALHVY